ncbi:hypothetical protein ASF62_11880 [Leifsonia sp. Leaf325]|nr:hypothetical protein ASF62_11880 [Leifsonia sp. Leaf325]
MATRLGITALAADDWILASALQHEYVRAIRRVLERRGISVPVFADDAEQGYLRTLRMLKGEVVMRFEDVVRAERVLEIDLSAIPRLVRERG